MHIVGQIQEAGRWVTVADDMKPMRYRARVKFRDSDGILRDVERYAPTKAKAQTLLKAALADRRAPTRGDYLRSETILTRAGELWLAQVDRPDSGLSDNTRRQYRDSFNRYVKGSSIAGLTLREVNRVPVLRAYLQGVADEHGTGAGKTARSVLSGIIGLAVTDGVLELNAVRNLRPAKSSKPKATVRDTRRAMTRDERELLIKTADNHEPTEHLDVADVLAFMAGTGVRISEALGQRWEDVRFDDATVFVRGTKTAHAERLLSLPPWLIERLQDRAVKTGKVGLVFPSPFSQDRDKPRDRRNVARSLRLIFDAAGLPWATPHALRRTVATLLDEAGVPIAVVADQLGHADPSMTARAYLGRHGDLSAAASVL
jgi:integrase